jgi:hypothetical protein
MKDLIKRYIDERKRFEEVLFDALKSDNGLARNLAERAIIEFEKEEDFLPPSQVHNIKDTYRNIKLLNRCIEIRAKYLPVLDAIMQTDSQHKIQVVFADTIKEARLLLETISAVENNQN